MLRTKNWGKEKKIGDLILYWTLAEALEWRQKQHSVSIQHAFDELRTVLSPKHAKRGRRWLVWASGIQAGWRPTKGWRSGTLPPYRPLEDPNHPPVHCRDAYPIPAKEWPELVLSSVDEVAIGKLDYAHERTIAWHDVHLPRDELISVWLPLIDALGAMPQERAIVPDAATATRQEPSARAPGISANAQRHYDDAIALDPEFDRKHGGIAKVVRALAKGHKAGGPTIRRDLNRVLRIKKGMNVQK
jgi:hypothetical protein